MQGPADLNRVRRRTRETAVRYSSGNRDKASRCRCPLVDVRMTRVLRPCESRLMDPEQTTSLADPAYPARAARSRAAIAANLASFQRAALPRHGRRPSPLVAVCLVAAAGLRRVLPADHPQGADALRWHAGQWALPGGRRDAGESATEAAPCGNCHEETGVRVAPGDVLGRARRLRHTLGLPDHPGRGVGWPGEPGTRGPVAEVAQIYVIPVADFDVEPRLLRIPESAAPSSSCRCSVGRCTRRRPRHLPVLPGGTARPPIRVAHFEQPVFAWK